MQSLGRKLKMAEVILRNDPNANHEYLFIRSLDTFITAAQKLLLGADSTAIRDKPTRITLQEMNGVTQDDRARIAEVIKQHGHFPFFDCAYQGLASGDLLRDAWVVRHFVEQGLELSFAQSFAKNIGIPMQRQLLNTSQVNLLSFTGLKSQSLPAYRVRIASCVLNDLALFAQWEEELRIMSGRLSGMHREVQRQLEARVRGPGSVLINYWTIDGRVSVAGLNTKNCGYFVEAVDKTVCGSV
ncbi:Aspartate aminotransferase, cytoplasmic [Aspergillus hancockii]|nr:Aspartate aminotransferase, cytoplasmic [Aspergillus hancockii]